MKRIIAALILIISSLTIPVRAADISALGSATSGGSGTVTSVGLSLPSFLTVTNSPVTVTGTLTGTLASETANTFLCAPSGSSGTPTFRAILSADIPTLNQNTTGNAANITGTAAVANGGTGTATAFTTGSAIFAGASGTYSQNNADFFWDATHDRLGVGTAAPAIDLDVQTNQATQAGINTGNSNQAGQGICQIYNATSGAVSVLGVNGSSRTGTTLGINSANMCFLEFVSVSSGVAAIYNQANFAMVFGVNNAEDFRINQGGKIGFGDTNPSEEVSVVGNVKAYHHVGAGTAPTVATGTGAGATGSPSASFDAAAHDLAGTLTVVTATAPSTGATVATVTFGTAYGAAPHVVLYPANAITATLSGTSMVYVTSTTGTFVITSGTVGLTGASTYAWNYLVAQ